VEKPLNPRTNIAIPGIYFYDENVLEYANELKPSNRNELEITDLNRIYLEKKSLNIQIFPRGTAWLDTGTFNSLHDASSYIRALEERQGSKISCIEEIAFRNGWISAIELEKIALQFPANNFGKYLLTLIDSSNPFSW